jgi:hypothetical protein
MNTKTHKLAMLVVGPFLAACAVQAYDLNLSSNLPPVTFHGFASQGLLLSSDYNYLGNTTQGSLNFTELGLNASINPFPRTRISVQGFDFDVGNVNEYDPFLDYAQIEYTFNDDIGIRAGRIRRPGGIYNHIQDVDLARTSVLLPQGVYDCRWRDFYCSIDGGEVFGSISLKKAGSISYEAYAGVLSPSDNGGVARFVQNGVYGTGLAFSSIDQSPILGAQLWYYTPLDGLRAGFSGGFVSDVGYTVASPTGMTIHSVINIPFLQGSLEYVWKSWTFQAEYFTMNLSGNTYTRVMTPFGPMTFTQTSGSLQREAWYVGASHRFNKWAEAGVYYTEDYENTESTGNSKDFQKDLALSLRFDLTDWWIFKVEGHYIHGTGLINDTAANRGITFDDRGWFMLALKTTVSF